jgi:cytochrome c oxidase subunit 1
MAIETQPERAQGSGGGAPGAALSARQWWRRASDPHALLGAVIGCLLDHLLGNFLAGAGDAQYPNIALSDSSDWPIVLGYLLAIVGWLAGLGVFNDTLRQMVGRPVTAENTQETEQRGGLAKYFRYELDHKVVGIQYLVGMIIYFCTAGLFAMAIRTELLSPTHHVFTSQVYVEIVGERRG